VIIPRRSFLLGLSALVTAPAIVRFENIMPVRSIERLINGVPELFFYDSEGGVLYSTPAPSEPIDPNVFGQIYNSPGVQFNVPRTAVITHVELRHPKFGRLQIQLGDPGPRYVSIGQVAALDKFDVKITNDRS
jgi:hypothetical protein